MCIYLCLCLLPEDAVSCYEPMYNLTERAATLFFFILPLTTAILRLRKNLNRITSIL